MSGGGQGQRSRKRALRRLAGRLAAYSRRNDLETFASAISYQIIYAVVPVLLAGVALLGFLDLSQLWQERLAPRAQEVMTDDAFGFIDAALTQVLQARRSFWLTFGLLFALWQISGAVRATMTVMNRIYGARESRSWSRRMLLSVALAAVVGLFILISVIMLQFGPTLIDDLELAGALRVAAGAARWGTALLAMWAIVAIFLRWAPAVRQPIARSWLTALVVVGGWTLFMLIFRWYATSVASYSTVYGNLATLIVAMSLVYTTTVLFLFGLQLDAMLKERAPELESDRGD